MLEFDEADADDDEGDDPEGDLSPWRNRVGCDNKPADDDACTAEVDGDGPVEPEPLRTAAVCDEQGDSDTEQHSTEDVWEEGSGHFRHPECLDQPLGVDEQEQTQQEVDQGVDKKERVFHRNFLQDTSRIDPCSSTTTDS